MTTAKALLNDIAPFALLLMGAEDYGTKRGGIAHYGTATRANPYSRRRMGYLHWCDFEMVGPNTATSGGPESVRRFTHQDQGWRLDARWAVADLDETKNGRHRSKEQLIAQLPANMFCMVPTTTDGHWQAWWLHHTPIELVKARAVRRQLSLYGADPLYYDTTLAHNPIHRSLYPWANGRQTWWNPEIELGVLPTVQPEHLHHPSFEQSLDGNAVPEEEPTEQEPFEVAEGSSASLDELVEQMALMGKGDGRWQAVGLYLRKVGCAQRKALGRDLTYAEVLRIAEQGNQVFITPKSDQEVESHARFFLVDRFWERQSIRGKRSAVVKTEQANARYEAWSVKLQFLKSPLGCPNPLTTNERQRSGSYGGRPGTYNHLAHTLNESEGVVKLVFHRGRRREILKREGQTKGYVNQ